MTETVKCEALRDIYSTLNGVGQRKRGERFDAPGWWAEQMLAIEPPMLRVEGQTNPKDQRVSHAGPMEQRVSSLLEVHRSQKNKLPTPAPSMKRAGAKSSR